MKRFGIAVLGVMSLTVLTATPALAQGSPIGPPSDEDEILGEVILQGPGGVAFSGSEVAVWMVLAVALLVVGVAFLIAGWRRARTAST